MKNLCGVPSADETILEELYLANITSVKCPKNDGEVPYSFVGKVGKWTLKRAWVYWVASVEDDADGLPLKKALELHYKKHPIKNENLGRSIRCGGHAGSPSPDEYGAQPIYNEGKLTVERYVNCYHIDDLIGLKEFAKFIKDLEVVDFNHVTENEEIVKLIKQREQIENEIIKIDDTALIRYEIERLGLCK